VIEIVVRVKTEMFMKQMYEHVMQHGLNGEIQFTVNEKSSMSFTWMALDDLPYKPLVQIPPALIDRLAEQVNSWGRECCGGCGEEIDRRTGERWGEPYFAFAKLLQGLKPWRRK